MTEDEQPQPAVERRGGKKVDWAKVQPGQEVPEQDPAAPEPAT